MKKIFLILWFCIGSYASNGQTNIINIYNSHVTIVNPNPKNIPATPVEETTKTNKLVVLPRYYMERLEWERMLIRRQAQAYNLYLRRYNK